MQIRSTSSLRGLVTVTAAAVGVAIVSLTLAARTASSPAESPAVPGQAQAPASPSGDVARGEYLVNAVAMCVQCHSPRDASGGIIESRRLTGAAMPVRGPSWSTEWAYQAPAIARLSGFTDDQIMMLLTEGHAGDRPRPKSPMPQFRMTRDDAAAVIAYLRSR